MRDVNLWQHAKFHLRSIHQNDCTLLLSTFNYHYMSNHAMSLVGIDLFVVQAAESSVYWRSSCQQSISGLYCTVHLWRLQLVFRYAMSSNFAQSLQTRSGLHMQVHMLDVTYTHYTLCRWPSLKFGWTNYHVSYNASTWFTRKKKNSAMTHIKGMQGPPIEWTKTDSWPWAIYMFMSDGWMIWTRHKIF